MMQKNGAVAPQGVKTTGATRKTESKGTRYFLAHFSVEFETFASCRELEDAVTHNVADRCKK